MAQDVVVSVIMPVYNAGPFLRPAIQSVLRQRGPSFELIVIDDGSQDGSAETLRGISDQRVRTVYHSVNQGTIPTRQEGLSLCRGRYVAWADADDLSLPDRFRSQVDFLDNRADVVVLGSAGRLIDERDRRIGLWTVPTDPLTVRWASLLTNPFIASSVMVRHDVLRQNEITLEREYFVAEDYDLWTKCLRYGQGVNLGIPLVAYRTHPASDTRNKRALQLQSHDRIALRTVGEVLPEFPTTLAEISALREVVAGGQGIGARGGSGPLLGERYLQMFTAFRQAMGGWKSKPLRRNAAWMLARKFACASWSLSSIRLLTQALVLDPGLPMEGFARMVNRLAVGFQPSRWFSRFNSHPPASDDAEMAS